MFHVNAVLFHQGQEVITEMCSQLHGSTKQYNRNATWIKDKSRLGVHGDDSPISSKSLQ